MGHPKMLLDHTTPTHPCWSRSRLPSSRWNHLCCCCCRPAQPLEMIMMKKTRKEEKKWMIRNTGNPFLGRIGSQQRYCHRRGREYETLATLWEGETRLLAVAQLFPECGGWRTIVGASLESVDSSSMQPHNRVPSPTKLPSPRLKSQQMRTLN